LRALRARLGRAPLARRRRETAVLLDALGVEPERAHRIRLAFRNAIAKTHPFDVDHLDDLTIHPGDECPWVTYVAPYAGWFWEYVWSRRGEADVPIFDRYLDSGGRIGSRLQARVLDSEDDDAAEVEYYTAHHVWHTALEDGPVEGYVALEFNTSDYSGIVHDQWGSSDAVWNQWARAVFNVVDPMGPSESHESKIFNLIDTAWGDDHEWTEQVAGAKEQRIYYFRTTNSFSRGHALRVEAGVRNHMWFDSNDQSVHLEDDLDLRLVHVMLRSCPSGGPILRRRGRRARK
jgi:hypothetical protein